MASSTSSNGPDTGPRKYAYNIEAAREREMHLYLPYWGFSQSEKYAQQSTGYSPNVSRDNVLTVFAQLASLRLDTKRVLISLFDRTTQYVVAESTRKLGLRSQKSGESSDALWRGVQQLPRDEIPMCKLAMDSFTSQRKDSFIVPDLWEDDRFKSAPIVAGSPSHRFYISVPIRSPENYVIGSVVVLDDKPRYRVSDESIDLLHEVSVTIMEYLISRRAMREEHREEKMVRALGLFVRGKADLSEGIDGATASDRKQDDLDQVSEKLEQVQIADEAGEDRNSDDRGRLPKASGDKHRATERTKKVDASESRSPIRKFKSQDDDEKEPEATTEDDEQPPALTPTTKQLKRKLAPSNVQSALNRASCLMNQALDVEGALFLDASVYTRRLMIGSITDNDNSQTQVSTGKVSSGDDHVNGQKDNGFEEEGKDSRTLVLGYATSSDSSKTKGQGESHYISIPGSFVNHLIDRYPRGKIFHIERDGSIAVSFEGLADDVSQAYDAKDRVVKAVSPKEQNLEIEMMEIKYLHKVLPDARCIAIYPVWDFQRGRWFTVNLVWANDPGRILSEPKDLTYMAAFSNSVMAEVSRMDVEAADRAKGDFISSISHELRSPLHGILGTVELLQETVSTYAQKGLVDTVYSCGRTLLDTLNHLLDYAKINTLTTPAASALAEKGDGGNTSISQPKIAVPGILQGEDLASLAQEVIEGLLAGAEFHSREVNSAPETARDTGRRGSALLETGKGDGRMITIVDIEWQDSWHYPVYAGAWRRVIMNLFGNALKYTASGYIRLLMKRDTMNVNTHETVPAVRLIVSDSGRGMSRDFLVNHLCMAFVQEDTESPGLGVGLHLVHQIVKSLGGKIEFRSEVDKGTDVDVIIPVDVSSPRSAIDSPYQPLRQRLNGKTVSFFTRSLQRGDLHIGSDTFNDILSSLNHMVSEWFGLKVLDMKALESGPADFIIVTDHEYRTMAQDSVESDVRRPIESRSTYPLIVLSAQASSWKVVKENDEDRAVFLAQPVSPRSLATAFEHCLNQGGKGNENQAKKISLLANHLGTEIDFPSKQQSEFKSPDQGDECKPEESSEVLLVEDNPVNLKIIETCVKNANFRYQTAKNGKEALEKFEKNAFKVVVMDISMPVMDGLSASRAMRHFERKSGRPPASIVILTSVLSSEKQQEANDSGVNVFLTKPVPLKQLREMLHKFAHSTDDERE
ncbi:sensor histidine kinase/response regulator [Aspergillus steynii IBT 23096]|uniref:histidine kinase n=1 Tax=Aspergillus steynii IBT 23096 TaxID=1392250 RepID=A0A2I2GF17_9EURO|nr:sensor histidine kinase/response regulator [Aspergillus steynii IBT 23096]PLB51478.1 sensor histidine kinase/response regulator [Aspergillus steynii IBT 23096]